MCIFLYGDVSFPSKPPHYQCHTCTHIFKCTSAYFCKREPQKWNYWITRLLDWWHILFVLNKYCQLLKDTELVYTFIVSKHTSFYISSPILVIISHFFFQSILWVNNSVSHYFVFYFPTYWRS